MIRDKQSVLLKATRSLGIANHTDPAQIHNHAGERFVLLWKLNHNGSYSIDLNLWSFTYLTNKHTYISFSGVHATGYSQVPPLGWVKISRVPQKSCTAHPPLVPIRLRSKQ